MIYRHQTAFLARFAGALLAVGALLWGLAGCDRQSTTGPRQSPTAVAPNAAQVKELCDYFALRPLETLGTEGAQGQVNVLADQPGIPLTLRSVAHGYYADGITRPDTEEHRATLNTRYETVLFSCRHARTGWERP